MCRSHLLVLLVSAGACAPTSPSPSSYEGDAADTAGETPEWLSRALERLTPPPRPEPRMRYRLTGSVAGERFGEVSGEATCVEGGKFSVDASGDFAFEGTDEPCRLNVFLRYDGMIGRGPTVTVTRASATGTQLSAPGFDELAPLDDVQIALLASIASIARRSYEQSDGTRVRSREHAELLEHHIRRARERRGLE